jgi:hypothetical protein
MDLARPRDDDADDDAPAGGRVLTGLRLVLALALVAGPAWVLATTGDAVGHQHWSLAALLALSAVVGLALGVATVLAARHTPIDRRHGDGRRRRVLRATVAGLGFAALVVLAAAVVWLRPFVATAPALAALESDDAVEVREEAGWYAFVPRDGDPTTGLVYSPGARVDARATAAVLRPLAEAGYLVVSLKEPLGIAFTSPAQSAAAMDAFGGVDRWAVGGHSLGGVVASSFAADHEDEVDGLLLHGSYPSKDISGTDLLVTSVWGSRDGLSTPDEIEASRADLPPGTRFVEVPGGVHAFFADYGEQPGDGVPGTSRADAQAQIVTASLEALDAVAAAP